jgi:hypothetical protein
MLGQGEQHQHIRRQVAVLGFSPQKLMDYI